MTYIIATSVDNAGKKFDHVYYATLVDNEGEESVLEQSIIFLSHKRG